MLCTELPQLPAVALLLQKQCPVQQQPDLQRPAEQAGEKFEVAYLCQALPALLLQRRPIGRLRQPQAMMRGQIPTERCDALSEGGLRSRRGRQVAVHFPGLALPDIECQSPRHGLVAQTANPLAGGDAFLKGEAQLLPRQPELTVAGSSGQGLVMVCTDAVIAAR